MASLESRRARRLARLPGNLTAEPVHRRGAGRTMAAGDSFIKTPDDDGRSWMTRNVLLIRWSHVRILPGAPSR
jgi:hypothetical protein